VWIFMVVRLFEPPPCQDHMGQGSMRGATPATPHDHVRGANWTETPGGSTVRGSSRRRQRQRLQGYIAMNYQTTFLGAASKGPPG
jgi:hypothetical protein